MKVVIIGGTGPIESKLVTRLRDHRGVSAWRISFYEGPDDVHLVSRAVSSTKPAKLPVLMVKDKGAPVVVPVQGED